VILRIIDQLEHLFPQHRSLLSILKRNFAWRLKDPLLSSVQRPVEREGGMKEPGVKEYQEGIDG
jgi:hypothetical protein